MRRIVVVGGPGSGKTSLAAELATRLHVPHVEMDALWWAPNWTPAGEPEFCTRLSAAVAVDGWVVDGHYVDEGAAAIAWRAADTIVWLDLPRRIAVARAVRRATWRVVRRTELWGTNRQGLSTLSPRSIASLVRRWPTYSARIAEVLAADDDADRTVVRLRTPGDVAAWLERIR
jgi:adenylate kinase family enzyme